MWAEKATPRIAICNREDWGAVSGGKKGEWCSHGVVFGWDILYRHNTGKDDLLQKGTNHEPTFFKKKKKKLQIKDVVLYWLLTGWF